MHSRNTCIFGDYAYSFLLINLTPNIMHKPDLQYFDQTSFCNVTPNNASSGLWEDVILYVIQNVIQQVLVIITLSLRPEEALLEVTS